MDDENKPAENVTEAASPAASDKSAALWRQILLVLCAVGAGLVIGILALQVTEYLFYKAPPDVWPQPGAGGTVSAPATLAAPSVSVPLMTPTDAPASPIGLTPTNASTNAPVVAQP
ncbi:MAG: hypothetical protein L6437_12525 [Kiritimatiellae bacterium]|nr:hypothetical protein [Verrucomicrobiota bacterium]MBU4285470.1 hypothetical protein [Verrucomicrobiota bacterium]MBU4366575.1 hypothetical protein [Verrucomicrobiota bacterium]MCG2661055.1 hypothetical protein [Kiritimatiellia bacterium]